MTGLFFPERVSLQLDGRKYSAAVREKIVTAGGLAKSYDAAAKLLRLLGEIDVSSRQVNKLTIEIGKELQVERDARTEAYCSRPLTQAPVQVEPPVVLACIELDGGRMQTRSPDAGSGVHDPHWRETKNAGFFRMTSETFQEDPHPGLPSCFADPRRMRDLLPGLSEVDGDGAASVTEKPDMSWRPKTLFRTCLSSLANSESFGPMMAAEADQRGFYAAVKQAFLGDGLPYNWTIQRNHFPTFTPIVDFIHPLERLYQVAKAVSADQESRWANYVNWASQCWQGKVSDVVATLLRWQNELGQPPDEAEEGDPRAVLAETITYLRNNATRMNYPQYRKQGLPITSCLIESLIKEVNYRVKGSEKFWNDGETGEAILQVRAALLSDDERLAKHCRNRPGSPYARRTQNSPTIAA